MLLQAVISILNISVPNLYQWNFFPPLFPPKQCLCFCTSSELEEQLGGR